MEIIELIFNFLFKKEQKLLEPEMQRMKEMEERRQERRNRLNELHVQPYEDDQLTSRNRQERIGALQDSGERHEKPAAHSERAQKASATFRVEGQQPSQQSQQSQQQPQQPQRVLVIDPRNRSDNGYVCSNHIIKFTL